MTSAQKSERYVRKICKYALSSYQRANSVCRQRTDGPFRLKLSNMQEGVFFSTSEPDLRCIFIRMDEYFWTSIVANVSNQSSSRT